MHQMFCSHWIVARATNILSLFVLIIACECQSLCALAPQSFLPVQMPSVAHATQESGQRWFQSLSQELDNLYKQQTSGVSQRVIFKLLASYGFKTRADGNNHIVATRADGCMLRFPLSHASGQTMRIKRTYLRTMARHLDAQAQESDLNLSSPSFLDEQTIKDIKKKSRERKKQVRLARRPAAQQQSQQDREQTQLQSPRKTRPTLRHGRAASETAEEVFLASRDDKVTVPDNSHPTVSHEEIRRRDVSENVRDILDFYDQLQFVLRIAHEEAHQRRLTLGSMSHSKHYRMSNANIISTPFQIIFDVARRAVPRYSTNLECSAFFEALAEQVRNPSSALQNFSRFESVLLEEALQNPQFLLLLNLQHEALQAVFHSFFEKEKCTALLMGDEVELAMGDVFANYRKATRVAESGKSKQRQIKSLKEIFADPLLVKLKGTFGHQLALEKHCEMIFMESKALVLTAQERKELGQTMVQVYAKLVQLLQDNPFGMTSHDRDSLIAELEDNRCDRAYFVLSALPIYSGELLEEAHTRWNVNASQELLSTQDAKALFEDVQRILRVQNDLDRFFSQEASDLARQYYLDEYCVTIMKIVSWGRCVHFLTILLTQPQERLRVLFSEHPALWQTLSEHVQHTLKQVQDRPALLDRRAFLRQCSAQELITKSFGTSDPSDQQLDFSAFYSSPQLKDHLRVLQILLDLLQLGHPEWWHLSKQADLEHWSRCYLREMQPQGFPFPVFSLPLTHHHVMVFTKLLKQYLQERKVQSYFTTITNPLVCQAGQISLLVDQMKGMLLSVRQIIPQLQHNADLHIRAQDLERLQHTTQNCFDELSQIEAIAPHKRAHVVLTAKDLAEGILAYSRIQDDLPRFKKAFDSWEMGWQQALKTAAGRAGKPPVVVIDDAQLGSGVPQGLSAPATQDDSQPTGSGGDAPAGNSKRKRTKPKPLWHEDQKRFLQQAAVSIAADGSNDTSFVIVDQPHQDSSIQVQISRHLADFLRAPLPDKPSQQLIKGRNAFRWALVRLLVIQCRQLPQAKWGNAQIVCAALSGFSREELSSLELYLDASDAQSALATLQREFSIFQPRFLEAIRGLLEQQSLGVMPGSWSVNEQGKTVFLFSDQEDGRSAPLQGIEDVLAAEALGTSS